MYAPNQETSKQRVDNWVESICCIKRELSELRYMHISVYLAAKTLTIHWLTLQKSTAFGSLYVYETSLELVTRKHDSFFFCASGVSVHLEFY